MIEQKRKDIGYRVRHYRKLANMTQEELAVKSGFAGKSSISQIEKGLSNLTEQKIESIAAALGVEEAVLRYGENYKTEYDPTDIIFKTDELDILPDDERKMILKAYNRINAYYRQLAMKKGVDDNEH